MRSLRRRDLHVGRAPGRAAPGDPRRACRRHRRRTGLRPRPDGGPRPDPAPGGDPVTRVLVLDVVGLTPRLLAHMPRLKALAANGFQAGLDTVLPAVTCPVQSTFLTGELPAGHGIV